MADDKLARAVEANIPTEVRCDLCGTLPTTLIDGKTRRGPWAYMCTDCYELHGVGLGTGRGQRYVNVDGKWLKDQG